MSETIDVYAFGVILWEILARGKQAYPAIKRKGVDVEILTQQLAARPPDVRRLLDCPDELAFALIKCWHHVPQKRPSFENLKDLLDQSMLMQELEHPIINSSANARYDARAAAVAASLPRSVSSASQAQSAGGSVVASVGDSATLRTVAIEAQSKNQERAFIESQLEDNLSTAQRRWIICWVTRRLMFASSNYEDKYLETYYYTPRYFKVCRGVGIVLVLFALFVILFTAGVSFSDTEIPFNLSKLTPILIHGFSVESKVYGNVSDTDLAPDFAVAKQEDDARTQVVDADSEVHWIFVVLMAILFVGSWSVSWLQRGARRLRAWQVVSVCLLAIQWVEVIRAILSLISFIEHDVVDIIITIGDPNSNVTDSSSPFCQVPFINGSLAFKHAWSTSSIDDSSAVACAVSLSVHGDYCANLRASFSEGAFQTMYLWTTSVLGSVSLLGVTWFFRAPFRIFALYSVAPICVSVFFLAAWLTQLEKFDEVFPNSHSARAAGYDASLSILSTTHSKLNAVEMVFA